MCFSGKRALIAFSVAFSKSIINIIGRRLSSIWFKIEDLRFLRITVAKLSNFGSAAIVGSEAPMIKIDQIKKQK